MTTKPRSPRYYYAAEWTYGGRPNTTARRRDAHGMLREVTVPACSFVRFGSQNALREHFKRHDDQAIQEAIERVTLRGVLFTYRHASGYVYVTARLP